MGNFFHPTAVVHPDAQIGHDNYIGPYTVIASGVRIGNGNRIESHVSIGTAAEKHGYFLSEGKVEIGSFNILREFVTVNAGAEKNTSISDRCILLRGSHLGHGVEVEQNCTISCNVLVGGESFIGKYSNLGLGSILHQFSTVPPWSFLGMGAVLTKTAKMKPGQIWVGSPARFLKMNDVGLQRNNVSDDELKQATLDFENRK
jgi:UDP-N-acetylglucosamine acyltransferase